MLKTATIKNFSFSEYSHKGNVRLINEDFCYSADTVNGYVFTVCDGVGGNNAGEVASETVAKVIVEFLTEKWVDSPQKALNFALEEANSTLLEKGKGNPELYGMATTITAVLIRDEKVYYAHAGDSRIYFCTKNKFFQITKDHSVTQVLIDRGKLTKKEALSHPQKNQITKAAGINSELKPSVSEEFINSHEGNYLILCTDGLYSEVTDKEIFKLIKEEGENDNIAELLVNKANENGGNDNITVQVIRFFQTENIQFEEKREVTKKTKKKKVLYVTLTLFVLFTLIISILYFFPFKKDVEKVKPKNLKNTVSVQTFLLEYENNDTLNINGYYVTKPGDTPRMISQMFNVKLQELYTLNSKEKMYFFAGEKVSLGIRKKEVSLDINKE